MNIQIIVDSCCDVTDALRNVLSLSLASLKITVGEHFYEDDGTIDTGVLVADMKACRTAPTTACPSPEEYAALMSQADASLVVTLSSKLSGSYNAACVGRDLALEEAPEKKIHVFDSESASAGETRIALLLRDMIDGAMGFEEIVEKTTAFIANMKTHFVLEDLGNLVKNGRISPPRAFGHHAEPAPHHGGKRPRRDHPAGKVRGTANAMRRLVELVAEETDHLPAASKLLVLSHCNCQERAMQLKKAFLERCAVFKDVIVVPTGGLSTVYANDGGIVIAFLKERVPFSRERAFYEIGTGGRPGRSENSSTST